MGELRTPQFWLAELDQYGNAKLTDGPHADRDGVAKALYIIKRLELTRGRSFACAEVHLTDVQPSANGANEEALNTLNAIGLGSPQDHSDLSTDTGERTT